MQNNSYNKFALIIERVIAKLYIDVSLVGFFLWNYISWMEPRKPLMPSSLRIICRIKCKLYEGQPLKYILEVWNRHEKLIPLNMLGAYKGLVQTARRWSHNMTNTLFSPCVCVLLVCVLCSKLCDSCNSKAKRLSIWKKCSVYRGRDRVCLPYPYRLLYEIMSVLLFA